MKNKIILFVVFECLAYDRTADTTCHGAYLSLDEARKEMLKKIEERFSHIKDDYCEDENEWKQWVKDRFWKRPKDDDHTVAWSDDDGDTVSKFFIDKVEAFQKEKESEQDENSNEETEEPERLLETAVDDKNIKDTLNTHSN